MNGLLDILLFPLYVGLFAVFFFFPGGEKKYKTITEKYHRTGFWIKVFSALAYIIFSRFIAKVDSLFSLLSRRIKHY